ncbi:MAG: TnpV protein [Desulfobacterales bacterium]|jgi:hypothetical protein|nr:TnpV protein [Desulfobacterales bacterium]
MDRFAELRKEYLKNRDKKFYKELKVAKDLERHCLERSRQAQERKNQLMESGLRDYEADEIVRAEICQG